ncbi:hypothetical protein ACG2LH_06150 [Zhouia sp. PK063]|uniref:hypothetical protein n=1 Tax=Zhouia sp. PK063 TaxID=3373602 RepID=UPI00379857DF
MKNVTPLLALFTIFLCITANAQSNDSFILTGKVLFNKVTVQGENVINLSTQNATSTDKNGDFSIEVSVGDRVVFTAINYQLRALDITEEIKKTKYVEVNVDEKVTVLDQVDVTNKDKIAVQLKNEEFKKFEYADSQVTPEKNYAINHPSLQNGVNFVNIFKALFKSKSKNEDDNKPKLKLSQVLRQVYDDKFFVHDLGIPQDKINQFLFYCDEKVPSENFMKDSNEFQIIDFLVNQSKAFKKENHIK